MPICDVMCPHSFVDPALMTSLFSASRIAMMRSAIILHSARHCDSRAGSESTALTMRAPWHGGLEYIGRMMILSCESTRAASSASSQIMFRTPTRSPYSPKFLANDWASATGTPSETKCRSANASASASPDAKPWYAESKKSERPGRFLSAAQMVRHSSGVGSIPVGLCAHACRSTAEPSGAASRSAIIPFRSSPFVSLSQ
mmetsp:Transcript_1329/g.3757  ORF Transcript_1329/g.3757 Transcript_1329/m.3757 type:complete len:201 (-) Transcript_1329:603-1205(-)